MSALWAIIGCGALSIVYGIWAIQSVMSADAGTQRMQEIAGAVAEGAQAYLKRQYMTIALVGVVVFVVLFFLLGGLVAIGFLIGAILSGAAGFIGMNVSVRANVRTAQAATRSLAEGLAISFKAGAVTGLLVAGLALLGVAIYYWFLTGPLGFKTDDRTVIDIQHDAAPFDTRLILIDRDGQTHASVMHSTSGNAGKYRSEVTFAVAPARLKEFRFQTRPFEWAEFPNVHLSPLRAPAGK